MAGLLDLDINRILEKTWGEHTTALRLEFRWKSRKHWYFQAQGFLRIEFVANILIAL